VGHSGQGTSQVEESLCLNWATQVWRWHMMVHVPIMFLSEWREFASAPCLAGGGKKLHGSSRLDVEIARRLTCLLSACVTRKDLQFST